MTTKITQEQLDSVQGLSSRAAAKALGLGKSTINDARKAAKANGGVLPYDPVAALTTAQQGIKILLLDLETSPNVAHVWGLWNQNVSIKQLLESTEVICFGAKWLDGDEVTFRSVFHDGKKAMLSEVHRLLDEADAVMGWNSKSFDMKHLNREFLEAGLLPPSPTKDLDLMLAVKRVFRFPSNKLDYVAQRLGVGAKVQHSGHELWIRCLAGDVEAWEEMKEYQIQDVELLVDLYYKLQPWIKNHPNTALYAGETDGCPNCGGTHLQRRGIETTSVSTFQRYQCMDCGKWLRSSTRIQGSTTRGL